MAKKLKGLSIDRIDLVDKGANPGAKVTLFKRAEPVSKDAKTKTVSGQVLHAGDFAYVGDAQYPETWKLPVHDEAHARNALARFNQTEGIPADKKAAVQWKIEAAAKRHGIEVSKMADSYQCPNCSKSFDSQSALEAHMAEEKDEMTKRLAEITKRAEAAEAQAAALKAKYEPPEEDPIAKAAVDPAVKAVIAKAKKDAEDAKKDAAAAREEVAKAVEERETADFIAKARDLPTIGAARTMGPILRRISKALEADEFKTLMDRLRAMDHQFRVSKAFSELGISGDEEGSAGDRLTAMAKDLQKQSVTKGEKGLSFEQAYQQVLTTPEGRELYAASSRNGRQ